MPGKFGNLLFSSYPENPRMKDDPDGDAVSRLSAEASRVLSGSWRWSAEDVGFDLASERASRLCALAPLVSRVGGDFLVYTTKPMQREQVLPWTVSAPEEIERPISLAACRGEYEPASLAVFALRKLGGVNLEISEFVSVRGTTCPALLLSLML